MSSDDTRIHSKISLKRMLENEYDRLYNSAYCTNCILFDLRINLARIAYDIRHINRQPIIDKLIVEKNKIETTISEENTKINEINIKMNAIKNNRFILIDFSQWCGCGIPNC